MNHWIPQVIADYFGNDILQDPEEFFHKEKENEDFESIASMQILYFFIFIFLI